MIRAAVFHYGRFIRHFLWASVLVGMNACVTTTEFYRLAHTPKALLPGISIESRFNNQKLVDDFTRIPKSFYRDSPGHAELKQRMADAN